ncbi:hypothetical protein Salat_1740800 [Sesamum alatum]|uniref:Uncharacterized protein n=1 Tax=Sesamum alatum TaxID=300844 RepID=A0AAE1Y875_9LAMI|nr:hypothetical protein Salat_1740800 [Sesamum alatum]
MLYSKVMAAPRCRLQDDEQEGMDLNCLRGEQEEIQKQEVSTEKRFLQSKTKRALLASFKEEGVSEFKNSGEFHNYVPDHGGVIYDQAIRSCRCTLRESGRFVESDVMLLDPRVAEEVVVALSSVGGDSEVIVGEVVPQGG